MKRKSMLAALLAALLLVGCGAQAAPETTPVTETQSPVVETQPAPTQTPTQMPAQPAAEETVIPGEVIPVITGEQTTVTVTTADEFLAAIASDTEILVATELIDWSTATGYGEASGENWYWTDPFDGPELTISGVTNLTIRGAGEDRTNTISAVPRYAYVLNFENCANIYLEGLTIGHTKEPGSCRGGVVSFWNSQDILIENCGLYGCGTWGVFGDSSKNMQIVNNEIYECSIGGVTLTNCDDVNIDGNTFWDLPTEIAIYGCGTVTLNGEPVRDYNPRG